MAVFLFGSAKFAQNFKKSMMNNDNFGALFDLDGVIIDSEGTYSLFWEEIDRIYPTGIDDFAKYIKGTTLPSILEHFPDEEVRTDIIGRLKGFQESMEYSLFPGAEDFLSELNQRRIPAAIVTSSDQGKMQHLFKQLPHLADYFDAIIDASLVTRSKPDPQGYLLGAEAIGIDPGNCFVFEDSLQGLRAGRAAGATVVALATTYPRTTVAPLASLVLDSFENFTVNELLALR